jgi:predicted lipoprotein
MKKLLDESEKERIKLLYESKGILLFEDNIFGTIARKALSWVGKNEDDIALLFKTSEKALATSIDDIVEVAAKSKSVAQLDDIQMKLMHFYNPSNLPANVPKAQQQMKNFLNGFAKSKGKTNWTQIKDEVLGKVESSGASAASKAVRNAMQGQRVSNRWYGWKPENIDFSKFTNKMSFDDLNKTISTAIKTNNWNLIPRSGFEKFGIPNFREYLQNNISKINELDPTTGRWSVVFK